MKINNSIKYLIEFIVFPVFAAVILLTGANFYLNHNVKYEKKGERVFRKADWLLNHTEITISPDSSIKVIRERPFSGNREYEKNNFMNDSLDIVTLGKNSFIRGSYSREWDKEDLAKDSVLYEKASQEFNEQLKRFGLEKYINP